MNTKTTAILALCLAALVVGLVFVRPQPQRTVGISTPAPTPATVHDLFEKKLGDITKTVVELKGKEPWTFEKKATEEGAPAVWRMTNPSEFPVASYEAERIGRELTGLKYEITFAKGDSGTPTDAQAGLAPPEAVVTLTDASNATVTVEIGNPFSENETYVRFKGGDAIVLAKSNLRKLFKTKPIEYRDMQVFNYAPENITKLEVIDRANPTSPVTYTFDKTGAQWTMETPAIAKATGKIEEMVRLLSRLRFSQWYEEGKDRLASFGLEPDTATIRITVDEPIPERKKDDAAEKKDADDEKKDVASDKKDTADQKKDAESKEGPPETKFKHSVRELRLSTRSPIGDDLKVYARVDDETMVGTLVKNSAEKFMPHPSDWQDMHLITSNTDAATRIEINAGGASAALVLKDGVWSFESDAARADDATVKELLKSIRDLNALAFVDTTPDEITHFGFEAPQADIRLIAPGAESGGDRLTVGGFSDPATRRVVYVRHNESNSIAKVRVDDVGNLIRPPTAYRDRTIAEIKPDKLQRITITRTEPAAPAGLTVSFEPKDGKWRMTAPVQADVREDRMNKLVQSFSELKAQSILSNSERSALGLDQPSIKVELEYGATPPVVGDDSKNSQSGAAESAAKVVLDAVEHEGRYFARREDRDAVYEIPKDFYDELTAEYRMPEIFTFDAAKVRQFTVRSGDRRNGFTRVSSGWTYDPEPALPLDAKKVDNFLLQIKDLKTERYVRYGEGDLSSLCLDHPEQEVVVQLQDATSQTLLVAHAPCANEANHNARLAEKQDVFLLTEEMVKRLQPSINELEKK